MLQSWYFSDIWLHEQPLFSEQLSIYSIQIIAIVLQILHIVGFPRFCALFLNFTHAFSRRTQSSFEFEANDINSKSDKVTRGAINHF